MHGGLDNLTMTIDNEWSYCDLGVTGYEEDVAKRLNDAETMNEIVDINVNLKIPAATK